MDGWRRRQIRRRFWAADGNHQSEGAARLTVVSSGESEPLGPRAAHGRCGGQPLRSCLLWAVPAQHEALSEYRPIVSEAHRLQHHSSMADKKLVLIPLIFICLRVWSTVRFVLTLCGSPAVRTPVLVVLHVRSSAPPDPCDSWHRVRSHPPAEWHVPRLQPAWGWRRALGPVCFPSCVRRAACEKQWTARVADQGHGGAIQRPRIVDRAAS